jgi:hypothetical protein
MYLTLFLRVATSGQSSHLPKERKLLITAFGPDLYLTYTEFDVSPQDVKK